MVANDTHAIIEESKCGVQHLNELQYVLFVKDTFDRKLFPNDFDNLTVHEQCSWINANIVKFFPNAPQSLANLIPAAFHEINHDRSLTEKPIWLDINKYRKGQKFVQNYFGSILVAILIGLVHFYSFDDALKPIIISKRTTPYLGFKRYLGLIQRIINWYNGEPWIEGTPAYKDMQHTCRMHTLMRKQLCKLTNEQIENKAKLAEPWCPDREILSKDFAAACPFQKIGMHAYEMYKFPNGAKGINNADMVGIQFSMISVAVLYPQYVGLHDVTDEDLEAYCHMWRCYGYFLGIEDEYNCCRGNLEEIKQRLQDLYKYWLIPEFRIYSPEWEHTTRCLVEPLNYYPFIYIPYKTMTLIATDTLNLNMPNLYASLSYTEWIAYKAWTFAHQQILKVSIIRHIYNRIVRKIFHTAANFSSEKLAQLQEKSNKQLQASVKTLVNKEYTQ